MSKMSIFSGNRKILFNSLKDPSGEHKETGHLYYLMQERLKLINGIVYVFLAHLGGWL